MADGASTRLVRDLVAFGPRRCLATLAAMLVGALLEGVGLVLLVPLLALLSGRGGGTVQAMANRGFATLGLDGQLSRLAFLLAVFVALILLRAVALARRDRLMAELQIGFVDARRAALLRALGEARWSDVAGLRHARVLHALDDNVERTATAVNLLVQAAAAAAMLVVQWLLVLVLAPVMAIAAAALVAAGGAVLLPAMRRTTRLGRDLAWGRLRLFDGTAQLLGGLKLAIAQNLQHAFIAELEHAASAQTRQRLELMRRFSRSRIAGTTAGALAGAMLVLIGTWYGTPLVALVAAVAAFTRMIGPATVVQQVAQQITGHLPAYAALQALHGDLARDDADDSAPIALPPRAAIRMEEVSYHHPGGGDGLNDVSIVLQPGEFVGVTGASGAGKTTFGDLVAGLLEPQRGRILIGDVALDRRSVRAWRDRIAYVGQDSYLFHDTIRRNLTLGSDDRTDAALWAALAMAGAADLVRAMSGGLDTVVAERGARLSGGQRQRIALARAMLGQPDLLILDEATNAIDVGGEAALLARLAALDPRPTILIVAHRVETLAFCERRLRFEHGRLVGDDG